MDSQAIEKALEFERVFATMRKPRTRNQAEREELKVHVAAVALIRATGAKNLGEAYSLLGRPRPPGL